MTQETLPSLLATNTFPLQHDFIGQNLNSEQALKLLNSFIQRPSTHPYVLPCALVARHQVLIDEMYYQNYYPGIITLCKGFSELKYQTAWFIDVIKPAIDDPRLCGSKEVVEFSMYHFEHPIPWHPYNPLDVIKETLKHHDFRLVMIDVFIVHFKAPQTLISTLASIRSALEKLDDIKDCETIAELTLLCEPTRVSHIQKEIVPMVLSKIDPQNLPMRALWHSKIIVFTLSVVKKVKPKEDDLRSAVDMVLEFFSEHDLNDIPPVPLRNN